MTAERMNNSLCSAIDNARVMWAFRLTASAEMTVAQ
jgi:hypothetical protein